MAEGGKSHRKKKSGRKAEKRKTAETKKRSGGDGGDAAALEAARKQNPKAFVFSSRGKAKIQRARTAEKDQRRMHVPAVERPVEEPPPFTVLVQGPPGVGKSTLIKCLIKHYTRQDVREAKGPVTVVAGKSRRLTFIECPQDLNGMIDAAKYADLVLLLVDGAFGFEMETFEFLNLLQVHGFPKVMGVLTHLDGFKDTKALKKTKKALKHRFWAEIYPGAKLFYLSGIKNGRYLKREVHNLARFVSVMKFRPLSWRQAHPYLLADRVEDVTPPEALRLDPRCDRDVAVYGYVRGTNWRRGGVAHLAGVGDFRVEEAGDMPDPCPLPSQMKRRSLNERERLIYAPMSDVGGLLFDKDAMYVDIPEWKVQYSAPGAVLQPGGDGATDAAGEAMVRGLAATKMAVDEKLDASKIQLFAGGRELTQADLEAEELRRAAAAAEVEESDDEEADSDDDAMEGSSGEEDSGSDDSDSEEEDEEGASGAAAARRRGPGGAQVVHAADGRVRRRAMFGGDAEAPAAAENYAFDDDSDEEQGGSDGGDSDDEQMGAASDEDESDDEDDDEEGLGNAARWKGAMLERAAALFSARAADLQDFIYGTRATADGAKASSGGAFAAGGSDDDDDELFRPKKAGGSGSGSGGGAGSAAARDVDALDTSRASLPVEAASRWAEPGAAEELRNRFVTGDWEAGAARAAARPEDDSDADGEAGDDDDEVYGDFEDIETGQRFEGSEDPATRAAAVAIRAAAAEEDIAAKKAAKKAAFNEEYDDGGGAKGVKDALSKEAAAATAAGAAAGDEPETFYDAMKREMADRAAKTKEAMDALNPVQRIAMEGLRPGTYVRLRFSGVPAEFLQHFDPRQPLLVGGLGRGEEAPGFMQLRLKRHRWFPKTLKNRDPLIFSVGWRRFQSLPVYAIKDNNERHRMLKYTPEHMHCLAAVWGPLAPPGTGVLAIQKADAGVSHWRVAATGVVLQLDASLRIVKKLKLVGTPFRIHRHTAFVNGMFNSQLEAAKFEGASVRTVSGIRGTIKKAVRQGTQTGARDGAFRATFEDKPLLSDVVFLRAWVEVDIPRFHNPVTNLLAPPPGGPKRKPKPAGKNRPVAEETPAEEAMASLELVDGHVERAFQPSAKFGGPRPGFVFTTGPQGIGYYEDLQGSGRGRIAVVTANGTSGDKKPEGKQSAGWVSMRTVADLRREAGVGAPRLNDSLYRPIERKKRVFNPLRVPAALQAALPFKSKPKLEAARKRKSLEQRRAVVVEPQERKALSLVAQLNAIRNAKAATRREQKARHAAKTAKAAAAEEAWRAELNKERKKKRYVEAGMAEKRAAKKARGD